MKYKILLSKQVQKFLDTLSDNYLINLKKKLDILSENPYNRNNNLDIVPLIGKPKNFFRMRFGDNRFLFEIRKS